MTKTACFTFLWMLLVAQIAIGQPLRKPKKIKADGDYVHNATGTTIPVSIGNYQRTGITAFDKPHDDIAIAYKDPSQGDVTLTVYLYPAGSATDTRFREAFLTELNAIAYLQDRELEAEQYYCFYKKGSYKINGYRAVINMSNRTKSVVDLYECGSWFLKIRLTTDRFDSATVAIFCNQIVSSFNPDNLIRISALSPAPQIVISREAFADSMLLGCTIGSALGKAKWVQDHVDSLENMAGFPSLYMDMHVAALKAFVEFADEHKEMPVGNFTQKCLDGLRSLIANGYLEEFIMEKHNLIMIPFDDKDFDSKGYYNWKKTHPTDDLRRRFFEIAYKPAGEIRKITK